MTNGLGRAAGACLVLATCTGCHDDSIPLSQLQGQVELWFSAEKTNVSLGFNARGEKLPRQNTCLVLDAEAWVNGVSIPQVEEGGDEQEWLGPSDHPCETPSYFLKFDRVPSWLRAPVTEIRLRDDTASFSAQVENLATVLTGFVPNDSGALVLSPGATNTIALDPPVPGLGAGFATLLFYPDYHQSMPTFVVSTATGELVLTDDSATFSVPAVPPASGWLVLTPQLMEPSILSCRGFSACQVAERPQHTITAPAAIVP
jgi:hypothetical protein